MRKIWKIGIRVFVAAPIFVIMGLLTWAVIIFLSVNQLHELSILGSLVLLVLTMKITERYNDFVRWEKYNRKG